MFVVVAVVVVVLMYFSQLRSSGCSERAFESYMVFKIGIP